MFCTEYGLLYNHTVLPSPVTTDSCKNDIDLKFTDYYT